MSRLEDRDDWDDSPDFDTEPHVSALPQVRAFLDSRQHVQCICAGRYGMPETHMAACPRSAQHDLVQHDLARDQAETVRSDREDQ